MSRHSPTGRHSRNWRNSPPLRRPVELPSMNISSLTLRDLEYLVAVADRRHFGKAADACHVSQPALSAQIRKIEDFLGVQLFERSNRNVVITPIGAQVAREARVVL